jgi:TfoX/Sxy family transcriptional regulator of competence genes
MAYDTRLARRVRDAAYRHRGVSEKAMFGGLAFLLDGKMFCGVLGDELLARVGPDGHDAAMARPHVRVMDFTGRPMRGYVYVGPAAIASAPELARWVDLCAAHAATLPDKPTRAVKTSAGKPTRAAPRRAAARPARKPARTAARKPASRSARKSPARRRS